MFRKPQKLLNARKRLAKRVVDAVVILADPAVHVVGAQRQTARRAASFQRWHRPHRTMPVASRALVDPVPKLSGLDVVRELVAAFIVGEEAVLRPQEDVDVGAPAGGDAGAADTAALRDVRDDPVL